jgi:hypothetical protein
MSLTENAIITAEDAAIVLGSLPQGDDLPVLELAIEAVSSLVRDKTNCDLVPLAATYAAEKIDGSGRLFLYLPHWPVTVLTSIYEDDVLLILDTDFYADLDNGVLERAGGLKWTKTQRGITATYTAGYLTQPNATPTIPVDLKLACAMQAIDLWKKLKDKSWSKTSQTIGSQTVNFSEKEIIPFVESTLKRYWREDYE